MALSWLVLLAVAALISVVAIAVILVLALSGRKDDPGNE